MICKNYESLGETVYTGELENGLKIIVVKKPGFAKKYAYFATNYGGADRKFKYSGQWRDTPMGVAHFLEHKMFDLPDGNALNMLAELGSSPNAYTSLDLTAYYFECVEKFEDNLKVLLNFVSTPYFTDESVSKEQGIIGQEIGMTEDNPGSEMYYGLLKCLFEENPIRDSIAGTVESISHITPEMLYACHKVFYNPSNMVLCVVGDVDENTVYSIAAEVITQDAGEVPERDYGTEKSDVPVNKFFEKKMQVSQPVFLAGSRVAVAESGTELLRDMLIGQLAADIFMGKSSPLYLKLYAKGAVKSDFSSEFDIAAGSAYTVFGGETAEYRSVIEDVCREAEKIAENGLPEGYFERIRKANIGHFLKSLNRFDDICYSMAKGVFDGYDPYETLNVLTSITEKEIVDFITNNYSAGKVACSVILPIAE